MLRIMAVIGGVLLIHPAAASDIIGLGLLAAVVVLQVIGKRRGKDQLQTAK